MRLGTWGLILPLYLSVCASFGMRFTLFGFHCHQQRNNIGNNEVSLWTKWSERDDVLRFLTCSCLII